MTDLLFDVPWYLPAVLAIVGIALFVSGNRRQQSRARNGGASLILLAICWGLVSYFVDTDKEKCVRATRALVQDVVDGKWPQFKTALDPTATFKIGDATVVDGPDAVANYARSGAESVRLKSATVQHMEVDQTGPFITARFDVFSTQESLAPVETSNWAFVWQQTNAGWKLQELRMVALKDVPTDQLQNMLPRAKK